MHPGRGIKEIKSKKIIIPEPQYIFTDVINTDVVSKKFVLDQTHLRFGLH